MTNCRLPFLFFLSILLGPLGAPSASANCPAPCIAVDLSSVSHAISPLLFGDQIQWKYYGQDLLSVDAVDPTTGTLRTDLIDALRPLGLTLLRYPGGNLSDFFHWNQATGPWGGRIAQKTDDLIGGTTDQFQTQRPVFGPDEFSDVAQRLGTEIMITANAGTGTPGEAAAWLAYLKARGVHATYWEIGNEVYLYGSPLTDLQHKDVVAYAGLFDATAAALRAVDPDARVGFVGAHLAGAPGGLDTWIADVLDRITEKADFVAVHNFYAPFDNTTNETAVEYKSLLAAPVTFRQNLDLVLADIAGHAKPNSRDLVIAVTEHAPFFLYPDGADFGTLAQGVSRNRSLGSALFSALSFNVMLREPRLRLANHINPVTGLWQAPLNVRWPNAPGLPGYNPGLPTYPVQYDPAPVASAFYHVFRLYREAAGGRALAAAVTGSPVFDSTPVGLIPAVLNVPVLDAAAVEVPDGRLLLYVVNRDLTNSVTATVEVAGAPRPLTGLSFARLNAADATARNDLAQPNAVTLEAGSLPPAVNFTMPFPAHSLTRFVWSREPLTGLDRAIVYPNPFHPGRSPFLVIGRLPEDARVRVLALNGALLRELRADVLGQARWDGWTAEGDAAPSGVYVALIDANGHRRKVKFVLQR